MTFAVCPSGNLSGNFKELVIDGQCFMFSSYARTWVESRDQCEKLDNTYALATIHDKEENTAIGSQVKFMNAHSFWIGFNDKALEGSFTWEDRSNTTYGTDYGSDLWASGNPTNVSFIQTILVD